MRNSSVKWDYMGNFDLGPNFPTNPRGHLGHFGLGSIAIECGFTLKRVRDMIRTYS